MATLESAEGWKVSIPAEGRLRGSVEMIGFAVVGGGAVVAATPGEKTRAGRASGRPLAATVASMSL